MLQRLCGNCVLRGFAQLVHENHAPNPEATDAFVGGFVNEFTVTEHGAVGFIMAECVRSPGRQAKYKPISRGKQFLRMQCRCAVSLRAFVCNLRKDWVLCIPVGLPQPLLPETSKNIRA